MQVQAHGHPADAALRGELVLGLAAHYLIGIALTLVYLGLLVVAHARPTALSVILYGTATTVFP